VGWVQTDTGTRLILRLNAFNIGDFQPTVPVAKPSLSKAGWQKTNAGDVMLTSLNNVAQSANKLTIYHFSKQFEGTEVIDGLTQTENPD